MLHAEMKNWIGTELGCSNIIIIDKKNTIKFNNSICSRVILCLSRGFNNSLLLYRTTG